MNSESNLKKIFPDYNIVTAETKIETVNNDIYLEEASFIAQSSRERKQEFIAGRWCAREALKQFGIFGFPLLNDSNGYPIWPAGIVGSISHSQNFCAVAIARNKSIVSIGIDIEGEKRIKKEIWPDIFTTKEIVFLDLLPSKEQKLLLSSLIFSAKECFYKFQFPLTKSWFKFKDIEVKVKIKKNKFIVSPLTNLKKFFGWGKRFEGNFVFNQDYVITGIYVYLEIGK